MTRIQLCLTCSIHPVHCRAVLIYWLFTLRLEKKAQRDTEGPENQHASLSPIQFSSVAQLCLTLCDPMIHSTSGPPNHHQTQSSLNLTSIESVMPSSHLILCHPLLLLLPIPPSIRVFSNETTLRMKWPKYWSFSFSIGPSKEHPGLISFRMDWLISLQSKGLSRVFSNTTVQKHQFFGTQLSPQSNSHIHT